MKKMRNLYRSWFFPPDFTVIKAHGMHLMHKGRLTGDYAYNLGELREKAWEIHDRNKTDG